MQCHRRRLTGLGPHWLRGRIVRLGIDLKVMKLPSHQAFSKEFAESIGDGALIKNKRRNWSLAAASERKDDLWDQEKHCQNPRTERAVEFYWIQVIETYNLQQQLGEKLMCMLAYHHPIIFLPSIWKRSHFHGVAQYGETTSGDEGEVHRLSSLVAWWQCGMCMSWQTLRLPLEMA